MLRKVEAEHLRKRPWGVLSQGERQRVLVGRALMCKAKLLILDEPCAGLDPVAREDFLLFINRLASRKRGAPTLVFVTHHVEEIIPAITHAALLSEGEFIATGPADEVLKTSKLRDTLVQQSNYGIVMVDTGCGSILGSGCTMWKHSCYPMDGIFPLGSSIRCNSRVSAT